MKLTGRDISAPIIKEKPEINILESIDTFKFKMLSIFSFLVLLIVSLVVLGFNSFFAAQEYFNTHEIIKNKVIDGQKIINAFSFPVTIKDKPLAVLAVQIDGTQAMVESASIIKSADQTLGEYICSKWSKEDCKVAIAIVMAESKFKEDAMSRNNKDGTRDYGIMQINERNWNIPGCSLKEIVNAKQNIDCGYKIWDRADGKEGDGKGKWTPWSAFNNGSFIAYYE